MRFLRGWNVTAEDKDELLAGQSDNEPIIDAIGADSDYSGLDIVSVPVIGAAAKAVVSDVAPAVDTPVAVADGDKIEQAAVAAVDECSSDDKAPKAAADLAADVDDGDSDDDSDGRSHIVRNIVIALLIALVLVIGGFVGWLAYDDSKNASCHVPAGVTLDGVNIGGFTANEVKSEVNRHLLAGQAGGITLKLSNGSNYHLDYARLGNVDVQTTVDAAMATIEPSAPKRCFERAKGLFGMADPVQPIELTTAGKLLEDKVAAKVADIAKDVDVEMKNAGYEFDAKKFKVKTTKAKTGYSIDQKATVDAILAASKSGAMEVAAIDKVTEPEKAKPGKAIFVNLSACHLYLYDNGKLVKDYPCTPGMSGYNTPAGDWTLSQKDPSPTWYNPHSDWSKNMPETIGPGATNPLGLRALAVSCGGGIYIHGTVNYGQLGTAASHGCIRLANPSVVELYDLVEVGIPIFIH